MPGNSEEPAFPSMVDVERFEDSLGKYVPHLVPMGGLSKREWFAGMAMQALIKMTNSDCASSEMKKLGFGYGETDKLVAKCAYDYANAMLAASKEKGS